MFVLNNLNFEFIKQKKTFKTWKKNQGNKQLSGALKKLIKDIEKAEWKNPLEIKEARPDADNVHPDGFYFFDINIHRTMILIVFEDSDASIV